MIRIVSVEGNIGSGKSTFLKFVANECANTKGIVILPEPVDKWEELKDQNGSSIIELFYRDKDKYAFPFQMMAYISRLALLREAVDKLSAAGGGVIVARGVCCVIDMCLHPCYATASTLALWSSRSTRGGSIISLMTCHVIICCTLGLHRR